MRITVVAKPNSRKESVEKLADGTFEVRVNAPAIGGKANEAVALALARYFSVPKSAVTILHGLKSKKKTIEIIRS